MVDFVLGLVLAALLLRGWVRGLVRETLGLVGLVLGTWVAFALSPLMGDFLTTGFGVTPEVARVGGGVVLFVLFGVALSAAAMLATRVMRLPGLTTANRLGGAAVAVAWGVAVMVVLVNVARVLPLSAEWEIRLEESTVAEAIAGPTALPQRLFHRVAGGTALVALTAIQDLFGTPRVVPQGDEVVEIPSAQTDEIRQVRGEAETILEEFKRFRASRELGALAQADQVTVLAEARAHAAYTEGRLGRSLDCRADLAPVERCTDLVALAATSLGAMDGIVGSGDGEVVLTDPAFDRAGVSVVDGPLGRLVVVVVAG
ncbi:MAG: CvpA family protein [Actinobacteria bacterium]|nr:CvpA family protein [Actinomycetota bacterium]